MIATTRIIFPKTTVRLAAGRASLSMEQQTLCFIAGANSIFYGEKLLTVDNSTVHEDVAMFHLLGIHHRPAFATPRGQPCPSTLC